ncbi:MAG: immunoglobulin domain-containing protein [Candidatus Acidiferrales bacterium]
MAHLSTVATVAAVLLGCALLAACGAGHSTTKASAPVITTNPMSVTVTAGAAATFNAAASGQPAPTVQWQVSTNGGATFTNISGANSPTLGIVGTTAALSGNEYQAVFMNASGSATTTPATLTVNTAPAITTNPANVTVAAGAPATFTAAASGTPTPTVQWQVSTSGGAFTNVSGATSTTLSIAVTTGAMNGNKYQAVFTNASGSATTTAATLTVTGGNTTPAITTNPANVTVTAAATATFTAAASGSPTPTVQWQVSTNGGGTFTNVAGATSTTLSITGTTVAMNGNEYRAVFTNAAGSATTTAATLTVNAANTAPTITTNPTNVTVTAGATATFTAAASGTPTPTVQWQVSTNGGTSFSAITGATSTTLSLTSTTVAMNTNKYRAVFTNAAGSATTTAATLTVNAANTAPTITTNPANVTVTAGATATFTAAASGSPTPTVQWQVSTNGGTSFTNVSGATSTTLSLTNTTNAMSGNRYRAVFTNTSGSATTTNATLTVNAGNTAPTITTDPTNVTVTACATATFTAAASGSPTPTVQWQVSTNGGGTFTNLSGATSTTLSIPGTTVAMNGNEYHAVFTNVAGSATTTNATLTVNAVANKTGTVMGGLVPVCNSTIQLYAVGTTGDGSASTPLLTGAPVHTDSSGNFALPSFTCPTPGSLVYITATGGNPGLAAGTNNAAILLMSALGACSTVTSAKQIVINELTTVATVFALETYMTSPTEIGSSSADAADLAKDFASVNELVDTTAGTTPGPALPAGDSVTATALNTLSDILAACVETAGGVAGDGSACGNLFTGATPPAPITGAAQPANSRAPQVLLTRKRAAKSGAQPESTGAPAAPTNTASATQSMAAHPLSNVAALFAVASPTGPYEPQEVSFATFFWDVNIVPDLGGGTFNGNLATGTIPATLNVPVGTTGVFFTDLVNSGTVSQTFTVAPATLSSLPVTLLACEMDPATEACLSAPSSSFSTTVAPNDAVGSYAVFVTATAAIPYNPVNNLVYLTFADSHGTVQVAGFTSVNTEIDVATLQVTEATASDNGVLTIPFSTQGTGAFSVEVANFGIPTDAGIVTASGNLPVNITICQTNPSNGQCLAPPVSGGMGIELPLATGASATFSVFVTATAAIASDPGNRIYITVTNSAQTGGGLTSVGVVTD